MTSPNIMTAEMPAENQNPLAATGEAFHSFAGRISNGLRSGYEAIREVPGNIKTYAAIGASAVTLFTLANAESAVANPDPFAGENVPTLLGDTAPQATSGSLEQQCATDILKPGEIIDSVMDDASKVDQSIFIKLQFGAVDPQCNGSFKRVVAIRPQMQDAKHRSHWINESIWNPIYTTKGNEAGIGGELFFNSHGNPKLFYPVGNGVHVRFQERLQEKNLVTGKIAQTEITNHPVKIRGKH